MKKNLINFMHIFFIAVDNRAVFWSFLAGNKAL